MAGHQKHSDKSEYSKPVDDLTNVKVGNAFKRFEQRFDIYCRSIWDEKIKSKRADDFYYGYYMPNAKVRKTDGFGLKDYALRNAAWHVSNVIRDIEVAGSYRKHNLGTRRKEGFWDYFTTHDKGWSEPYQFKDAQEATDDIRRVSEFFGAGMVGICAYDERWMYETVFDKEHKGAKPQEIPNDVTSVIVIAEPMDIDVIKTVPSALSGAATGLGYTHDAMAVISIAQYIRNMGYRAYASQNDSALGIPLGLQAGLGEVGRNGLLITEKFGPRFRISKIFTDMPLVHDVPKKFGVEKFCNICDRCAKACPPQAIPYDAPTDKVHSESNIPGVVKWTVNAEKCFKFWCNQNSDCIICVRSCPFNRDFSKLRHRLWLKLAKGPLRRVALWLDDKFVERGRVKVGAWWNAKRSGAKEVTSKQGDAKESDA